MVNIELRLLSLMLHSGDFSPIIQGEISADTFSTDQAKIALNLITNYNTQTNGRARFPSLAVARSRFETGMIELPDPDPGDNIWALVHECKLRKLRTDLKSMSVELDLIAEEDDPRELVPNLAVRLRKSIEQIDKGKHLSLREAFPEILDQYIDGNILPEGMPWPWPSFTVETRGMQRKEWYVIAGRPKSSKTFLAIEILTHAIMHSNARCLMITMEMPCRQMMLRSVATICRLPYREFKNSALQAAEEARLGEYCTQYGLLSDETDEHYGLRLAEFLKLPAGGKLPSLDVIEGTGRSLEWMKSQIELYEPDLVMVDAFSRSKLDGSKRSDVDWKAMTGVSRAFKDLAMETNVVMLGTHHMNRGADGKVGTTANLSLTDAVGQDGDLIMQAITATVHGQRKTALAIVGGREVAIDGIIVSNEPCYDYAELEVITNKKSQLAQFFENDDDDKKDGDEKKKNGDVSAQSAAIKKARKAGLSAVGKKTKKSREEALADNVRKAADKAQTRENSDHDSGLHGTDDLGLDKATQPTMMVDGEEPHYEEEDEGTYDMDDE